jgi:hypothetical protein
MLPRARGTIVFSSCFTLALLLCSVERVESQQSNVSVSNVLLRENVSQSHRRELTEKLRRITGWSDLAFDTNGALQAGSGQPEGGSQSARALIQKAITGARVIIVEDVSNREDVAFGSVTPGR